MNRGRRVMGVTLSVAAPIAIWLVLVAIGPRVLTPTGLVEAALALVALPAVLIGGFSLLVKAFPNRAFVLAWCYFPLMLVLLLYLGVMLAWRLHPEAF